MQTKLDKSACDLRVTILNIWIGPLLIMKCMLQYIYKIIHNVVDIVEERKERSKYRIMNLADVTRMPSQLE